MSANTQWHEFAGPEDLANALAARVADELRRTLDARGQALLAVSGGTTPQRFFHALCRQRLDWGSVTVTLVDERFVPPSSDRSNERLVRDNLLRNEATHAGFIALYLAASSVEEAAAAAAGTLGDAAMPLDVAILGMGTDGHTASFFADAANLNELLDPESEAIVLPVHPASAGEPRLTLSLARLVEARFVALHIEGSQKRDVLQSILGGASAPVGAVITAARRPVNVFWTGG